MGKKNIDKLRETVASLDTGALRDIIMSVAEDYGAGKMLKAAKAVVDLHIIVDFDMIKKDAIYVLDEEEEYFFRNLGHDEYRSYIEPGDHAAEMIEERIKDNFYADVKALVAAGRKDDVRTYIRAIAAGLRESDSILCEWSPDFPGEYADHLEECMEKGEPLEGFDW